MPFRSLLLIASFLPLCWLGMQAVHELGHVLAVVITGGEVTRVVLHPLNISRTDVDPNPHPLPVVWAGPLVGILLPLLAWFSVRRIGFSTVYLFRFFAGFCLIANGAYLGAGSFSRIGDAGELIRHGTPLWSLWLFGLVTVPAGFFLWNGEGSKFGLGPEARPPTRRLVTSLFLLLLAVIALESFWSPSE